MSVEQERLTLEKLVCRILEYKKQKPDHSAKSVGMTFQTTDHRYFFDTGTGKVFRMDEGVENFLYQLLYGDCSISNLRRTARKYQVDLNTVIEYIEKEDLLKGTEGTQVHQRLLTEKASPGLPMNGCCVPGARRLYIDTKGDLYACERINKSPKLGNTFTGFDLEAI